MSDDQIRLHAREQCLSLVVMRSHFLNSK